jgi:hypothetical protein
VKAPHPLLTPRRSPPQKWAVRIVRNSDKAFVDHATVLPDEAGRLLMAVTQGSLACDCSRHYLFQKAKGLPVFDEDAPDCGTGIYSIPRAVGEDGTVLEVEGGQ